MTLGEPAAVVTGHPVAVTDGEGDLVESVEGQFGLEARLAVPGRRQFLIVAPVGPLAAPCLRQHFRRLFPVGVGLGQADLDRVGADALQMALAEQGGAVARGAQQLGKGDGLAGQRDTVLPYAMQRRHPAGHQRAAVGHADRRRDIEPVEPRAVCRQPVDMGCADDIVAVTAKMICTVLIVDKQQKIGRVGHDVSLSS